MTGGNWHNMAGADYRIIWNLDGAANTVYDVTSGGGNGVYLQQWTGLPDWSTVGGLGADDLKIAWGTISGSPDYSVTECTLNPAYIGMPEKFFWGAYLDNGTTSADDASPNNMGQRGYTPEPTTLVLVPLGLAGLAAWRRRRVAAA